VPRTPHSAPAPDRESFPGVNRRTFLTGAAGVAGAALLARAALAQEPRQVEIYSRGVLGEKPAQEVAIEALEAAARERMAPEAYDYVAGGAGSEDTMQENLEAFRRRRIVPRMLRNVTERDLRVKVLGEELPAPVLLAPVGVQSIIHAEAEMGTARAARSLGLPMVLSTVSSRTMEQVAGELGGGARWFQLYWPRDPELAASFVTRAEKSGYSAIVVTLDTFLLGWRERDLQNAYLPFLKGEGLANYLSDGAFRAALPGRPEDNMQAVAQLFARNIANTELDWKDLPWLRRHTRLPILVKGIQHPEDAHEAVRAGVDGVIVSNHGGRQVDGAIASLDALPRIVEAVGTKTAVLFDSGIRRGADVIKAMALGAQAVLVGRPYCWGLAVNGGDGARMVLQNLLADLDVTLGLAGCASFEEVNRSILDL
jgi:lactate 2-monooxygenase